MTPISLARAARRGVERLGMLFIGGGLILGTAGCPYDPDAPCGPHQVVYGDNVRCVCEPGAALTENGCVPCGPHEVPGSSGCGCEAGYSRAAGASECTPTPAGLGAACDPSQPDCSDPRYSLCYEPANGGAPYCTSTDCASGCDGGYACDESVEPSVCLRPPAGLFQSCASSADCEGTEATYCDTFQTHSCLVQGCSLSTNDCFVGFECCDLSSFGVPQPLCIPAGACAQ